MMNRQSLEGTGIGPSFVNNTPTLVVAGPGKLYGFSGLSANNADFVQVHDGASIAAIQNSGTWTGSGPIIQVQAPNQGNLPNDYTQFDPPVALQQGLIMVMGTSVSSYATSTGAINLFAQFVPDNPSTLSSVKPS